jgi:hypothetical protein
MTPDLKQWHKSPPAEEEVLAEIGRTILAIQPTELLFNRLAKVILPEEPLTLEGLAVLAGEKKGQTFGALKGALEKKKVAFDPRFLGALTMFIDSRNKLVHRTWDIPGWSLESPEGRIAAFCFLKFLQAFNVQLRGILMGLALRNGEKPFEGNGAKIRAF